ncbi:MAG TPA: ketopantoate reductase C-terminal domain-containing protein, partial [Synergistales bacterium]|nr:ketopantoate reductase C-terminal domain-containing protein [Synergistales bacterium]
SIFGEERVCAGVAHYGAIKLAPGVVKEAGGAFIALGPCKRGVPMKWVSDILQRAVFNVEYVEDPSPFIWKKLAVNSMVNTTAALTGFNNAGLMNSPLIMDLMKRIGREAVIAAERAGVKIDFDDLWEVFIRNITRTASNIPSMLQDNRSGRRMEVDTIPGGVLRYARDGSEFPYTRAMYGTLKAIDTERGY